MAFEVGYSLDEAQLLLAFAAAAYVDETPLPGESIPAQTARMGRDIDTALGQAYPGWQVVWGPGLAADRGNMMYVAGNTSLNQYAVAIRGTDWSFWLDWVEDFGSLLPLVPLPYQLQVPNQDVKVAAGTLFGLDELVQMTGSIANGSDDLATFLKALPSDADVFVTGHSLGGRRIIKKNTWVAWLLGGSSRVKTYTFVAPSAGNAAFANYYYNGLFWDRASKTSTAYRLYNTLDSVPNAWASLSTITTYYQPAPLCPSYVKDIIADGEQDVGSEYVQVGTEAAGGAIPLPGTVVPWWSWWDLDPTGTAQFVHQVTVQHETATYNGLLSAVPTTVHTVKLAAMGARSAARRQS